MCNIRKERKMFQHFCINSRLFFSFPDEIIQSPTGWGDLANISGGYRQYRFRHPAFQTPSRWMLAFGSKHRRKLFFYEDFMTSRWFTEFVAGTRDPTSFIISTVYTYTANGSLNIEQPGSVSSSSRSQQLQTPSYPVYEARKTSGWNLMFLSKCLTYCNI